VANCWISSNVENLAALALIVVVFLPVTLLDVVGAEPIMLRRAGKNHEQRLLFLIHLPARLRPDSMDARMTLGNLMETMMIPPRLHMGLGARGMTKVVYPIIDRPQTLHTPFLDDQRVP
jgi:hypothetical protein